MINLDNITKNTEIILRELPENVSLVAAAKTKTPDEVGAAIKAGVRIIGENYVQEAIQAFEAIGNEVKWHFIGHLQKNKVKKAVEIFDLIETVDSIQIAEEINKRSKAIDKVMPVLVEVNSGEEVQKHGFLPGEVTGAVRDISVFSNIKVMGLMTMGPFSGEPEDARKYLVETKRIFDEIKTKNIEGVNMEYLSMGMTNSYKVAIEEGANMVRIGTKIFGDRG